MYSYTTQAFWILPTQTAMSWLRLDTVSLSVSERGHTQRNSIAEANSGHTFSLLMISCNSASQPLVFKRNFESDRLEYEAAERTGFWLNKEPDDGLYFEESTIWQTDGVPEPIIIQETKFPEAEVYVHPRLIDTTSVMAGINAVQDEADAPVYTLTGIMADRNNLAPGIYVSRGKKFVVK